MTVSLLDNSQSMAETPETRQTVTPRSRLAADGYVFVGEAAELLGVKADYRQMRRMHRLVREQAGLDPPEGSWTRYSLTDLACMEALIHACGGPAVFERGQRLRLGAIGRTCAWLNSLGFDNPLLQVPMRLEGRSAVVLLDEILTQPETGQLLLQSAFERLVSVSGRYGTRLRRELEREVVENTPSSWVAVSAPIKGMLDSHGSLSPNESRSKTQVPGI